MWRILFKENDCTSVCMPGGGIRMKKLMAKAISPGLVELTEEKLPSLENTQVLIEIKASSICGSDLHIYKGKHPSAPLPVTIGHELSGDVIALGANVSKIKMGDRVTVEPVIACGKCPYCLQGEYGYCISLSYHYRRGQGALANYFIADERYVYVLPESTSYNEGALIEPVAVAVHAVKRAKISLGDKVAIIGAGAIGLLITALSKRAGATEIVVADLDDFRLDMAKEFGATHVINSSEFSVENKISELTNNMGIDKTFECVGLEKTLVQAMSLLRKGGLATVIGIFEQPTVNIPASLFVSQEITVQGSQGYCWDFDTAIALAKELNLEALITHVFPLKEINQGFATALDPKAKAIKVVINP